MIVIVGRRWTDGNNNTYHSCEVWRCADVHQLLGRKPFEYGPGDQYIETALHIMQEAGLWANSGEFLPSGMSKDSYEFHQVLRREGYFFTVSDVRHKADL